LDCSNGIGYDTVCIIHLLGPSTVRIKVDTMSIMQRSQLRAARALLAWSQERLAKESGVSLPTIKRLEPGEGSLPTKVETLEKLQAALEAAGVEFTNGGEPGVKLKAKPTGPDAIPPDELNASNDE
jgi:transcriptional regulator with XRE-family HTH domain